MIRITNKKCTLQLGCDNREIRILGPVITLLAWDLRRVTCSYCCTFTLQVSHHIILQSNCNYSTEVHTDNYKALITELQIKVTAGSETTITITEQKKI